MMEGKLYLRGEKSYAFRKVGSWQLAVGIKLKRAIPF
jgi:hypothetical protein